MRLGALTGGAETAQVTGFAIDHRKVAPGTVFGAFPGTRVNGEDFIADAVRAGAVAVVARPQARVEGAVHIADAAPRERFAQAAAAFFAPFPRSVVAVTGTNGKTSTVEMTRQLWRMAGHHAASIGTLGITTAGERSQTGLTTPDVVTFLANVGGLAREGVTHLAFEASSHGLTQYRTEGLTVTAARRSPISAGTISTIMAIWLPISPPSCGCSRRCSPPMARRWCGPTISRRRGWSTSPAAAATG